jgi:hypothetical protein
MLKKLLTIIAPLILSCQSEEKNNFLSSADEITVDISPAGGVAELGKLRVDVRADTANTDFRIKISRTPKSVFEGAVDDISARDSSYIVELLDANGAQLAPEDLQQALKITIEHKIYDLSGNIMALVIKNISEDSSNWEKNFIPYEDLLIEAGLHLTQATIGDNVKVNFEIMAPNLAVQIIENDAPPIGYTRLAASSSSSDKNSGTGTGSTGAGTGSTGTGTGSTGTGTGSTGTALHFGFHHSSALTYSHVTNASGAWVVEEVMTYDSSGFPNFDPVVYGGALTIDQNKVPHVFLATSDGINYAYKPAQDWIIGGSLAPGAVYAMDGAIATKSDGTVVIIAEANGKQVEKFEGNAGNFSSSTLLEGEYGLPALDFNLAISDMDGVVASVSDSTNSGTEHAALLWGAVALPDVCRPEEYSKSIIVDSTGTTHMIFSCWISESNCHLKIFDGTTDTVLSNVTCGNHAEIAVAPDDTLFVVYGDSNNDLYMKVKAPASSWASSSAELIDANYSDSNGLAIGVDGDGQIQIAYVDDASRLRHISTVSGILQPSEIISNEDASAFYVTPRLSVEGTPNHNNW